MDLQQRTVEIYLTGNHHIFLLDNNQEPASPRLGQRSHGGCTDLHRPSDLSYRLADEQETSKVPKGSPLLEPQSYKNLFIYSNNITIQVEYFYFSPIQGLFCTRTVKTFATGVLSFSFFFFFFFLKISYMLSYIVSLWFVAFSCCAALDSELLNSL